MGKLGLCYPTYRGPHNSIFMSGSTCPKIPCSFHLETTWFYLRVSPQKLWRPCPPGELQLPHVTTNQSPRLEDIYRGFGAKKTR